MASGPGVLGLYVDDKRHSRNSVRLVPPLPPSSSALTERRRSSAARIRRSSIHFPQQTHKFPTRFDDLPPIDENPKVFIAVIIEINYNKQF